MDYFTRFFNSAFQALLPPNQNPAVAALRARYTPHQLRTLHELNEVVKLVQLKENEAPKEEAPITVAKQVMRRVENAIQEGEAALGPIHPNVAQTVAKLGPILIQRKDWMNAEKMLVRNLKIMERLCGKRSHPVLAIYLVLGRAYAELNDTEKIVLTQYEIVELHRHLLSEEDPTRLKYSGLFATILDGSKDLDWAEKLLRHNLKIYERVHEVDHPLRQTAISQLISVLTRQCHARLYTNDLVRPCETLCYIQDILRYNQDIVGSRNLVLGKLGRVCLWLQEDDDAVTAFKLQAAEEETSLPCIWCESEDHGLDHNDGVCNACNKVITMSMRRFICRICSDVDICGDCYEGREIGASVVQFLDTCRDHPFFEVPREPETKLSLQAWVQAFHCRIEQILRQETEGKRNLQLIGTCEPDYIYDGSSTAQFLRAVTDSSRTHESSSRFNTKVTLPGFILDKIDTIYRLEEINARDQAARLWFYDRLFMSSSRFWHRRLPSNPMAKILRQHVHDSMEFWAYPPITRSLQPPFFIRPQVFLEYSIILLDTFLEAFSQIDQMALNPQARQSAAFKTYAESKCATEAEKVSLGLRIDSAIANIFHHVEDRLLKLLQHLASRTGTDILGASLFNFDNMYKQVKDLKMPQTPKKLEDPIKDITTAMFRSVMPVYGSSAPSGELLHGKQMEMPDLQYNEIQLILTDCKYAEEVTMRVRVVLKAANEIRKLNKISSGPVSPPRFQDCLALLRRAETYWQKGRSRSPVNQLKVSTGPAQGKLENARDILAAQILSLDSQVKSVLGTAESSIASVNLQHNANFDTFAKLSMNDQEVAISQTISNLEQRISEINQSSPHHSNQRRYDWSMDSKETYCPKCTIFATTQGYVGLLVQGFEDVKTGDAIFLLDNAKLPLVARKIEETNSWEMKGFTTVRELASQDWRNLEDVQMLGKKLWRFC